MLCETGTGQESQKIVNPSQSCDRPTVRVSCTTGSVGMVFLVELGQAREQKNLLSIVQLVQAGETKIY